MRRALDFGSPSTRALVLTAGLAVLQTAPVAQAAEENPVNYASFEVSQLRCVIGNNAEMDEHRQGYNGIFSMWSPHQETTPFVPAYAGFNYEFVFDARPRHPDSSILFEPRRAPMTFTQVDSHSAELYQPETPHFGVESWTRFTVRGPYYVDVEFRCKGHKPLEGGFLGLFWASYMNAPHDKSIYFLGPGASLDEPRWLQYCTQQHDHYSTVLHENDPDTAEFQDGPPILWKQISPLRYSEPFFYGRFRNMVLIYIFEPTPWLRISHSPSGGGPTPNGTDTCPAWDFQMLIDGYEVGQEYAFKARVVYKPWEGREDVLAEVRRFHESL